MNRYDKNHRSSTDIIVSILEYVDEKGSTLKTHILYGANLNSKSLEKFLTKLISAGLLTKTIDDGKDRYFITARGRIFLHHMGRALNMLRDNKEIAVNIKVKEKLKNKKKSVYLKEGLIYRGASGTPYVLPVAFISRADGEDKVLAVMETINAEMTLKEAVSVIAWSWTISKDVNIPSIILVDESHIETALKISEALRENNDKIVMVKYGRHESPEAIARKIVSEIIDRISILAR